MAPSEDTNMSKKRALSPGQGGPWLLKKRRTCCTHQTMEDTTPARGACSRRHSTVGGEALLPRQVKRRRTCSSHGSAVFVSEGRGAAGKRRRSSGGGAALRLVLESPAVRVRRRRLPSGVPLRVDENNHVHGAVNGHACRVHLDTGAQISVLFWTQARRLGLLDGTEATSLMEVALWRGVEELDVVKLETVTVDLGGGVKVVTPVTVFPAWLEARYEAESLVLGARSLRRGGMVQVFGPGGSTLFVRRPERLRKPAPPPRRAPAMDVLRVRAAQACGADDEPMTVLLDTGAKGVFVSARRRDLLLQGENGRPLPRRLKVDLGGGRCVRAAPLEVVPSNDRDFVIGIDFLCAYGAVLDHARHTLDLRVGAAWWRLSTQAP